jgi:hypothetical protein
MDHTKSWIHQRESKGRVKISINSKSSESTTKKEASKEENRRERKRS